MDLKKYLLYPMMSILALCSCKKKSEVPSAVAPGTDIYLVGDYYSTNGNSTAAYWKNGQMVLLGDTLLSGTNATAIAVNGTDVYVSGTYTAANSYIIACYWKNGKRISLGDSTGYSYATDLTLNGPDLYIAGNYEAMANYWKNGELIPLPTPSLQGVPTFPSVGFRIAVSGTDVYVTGILNVPYSFTVAACWKNGIVQFLGDTTGGGAGSRADAIAVYNGDVYIAGQTFANLLPSSRAAYWKNGKIVQVPNDSSYSYASGIAVNGEGVYLAGYQENTASATIWNNGMVTTLFNDGYKVGNESSIPIALDGGDVYVAGSVGNSGGTAMGVYWKNGTLITTGINGVVNGIVVVSH